jgi:hypothetical protein
MNAKLLTRNIKNRRECMLGYWVSRGLLTKFAASDGYTAQVTNKNNVYRIHHGE